EPVGGSPPPYEAPSPPPSTHLWPPTASPSENVNASTGAAGFAGIVADPRPMAGTGGRTARPGGKRSSRSASAVDGKPNGKRWIAVGGGIAEVLMMFGVGWGALALRGTSDQPSGAAIGRGKAALVLEWPESQRRDASLLID